MYKCSAISVVYVSPSTASSFSLTCSRNMKRERDSRTICGHTNIIELISSCKKRTSKKDVDGRCTSSHENKTFRSKSVVKQKGMVFGFRKTATAVTRPER